MTTRSTLLRALIRSNFYFFVRRVLYELFPNEEIAADIPYLEAMCRVIQDVIEGRTPRLLITIPPRHLKSTCASVALPAYILGHHPDWEVMVVTYNQEFFSVHSRQFRQVILASWYRAAFPHTRVEKGQNRVDETRTMLGGGRKAVSVTGGITGRGAHVMIMDDMMKAQDIHSDVERERVKTVYRETLYSRQNTMDDPRQIALQQRLGEDDFAGYLLETGKFEHFNLPAIAQRDEELSLYNGRMFSRNEGDALNPEREPVERLEETRQIMGEHAFANQYLQDPAPTGTAFLRFDEIAKAATPPDRNLCAPLVQSWDPAFSAETTSDYSVCTTWGLHQECWYLLDVHRTKLDIVDLQKRIVAHRDQWTADNVIVEFDGSGRAVVNQLRADGHLYVTGAKTGMKNKEQRLVDQSARLVSGKFIIPTDVVWYDELRREFRAFPDGKHDDQVDSVSQFVAWIHSNHGKALFNRNPKTGRRIIGKRPSRRRPSG